MEGKSLNQNIDDWRKIVKHGLEDQDKLEALKIFEKKIYTSTCMFFGSSNKLSNSIDMMIRNDERGGRSLFPYTKTLKTGEYCQTGS